MRLTLAATALLVLVAPICCGIDRTPERTPPNASTVPKIKPSELIAAVKLAKFAYRSPAHESRAEG